MNQAAVTKILLAVATYYTLTRRQIQNLCLPGYEDRTVRKILLQLLQQGLLNKTSMEAVNPAMAGMAAPVYYPSRKGCDYLVAEL